MEEQPFTILAEGGMRPELSPSPPSSNLSESSSPRDSSPASSVSIATHDTSRTKYHIDELGTFAARLEHAAASVFPNKGRSRYGNVRVLLMRWEEDTMGVQYELEDLAEAFENMYGFETETWLIPTIKSHFSLMGKALQVVQDWGGAEDLLILYYAGHGLMNPSRQALWSCKSDVNYASVQWYAIQTLFEQAESDVLLLLDCCAAASSAPTDGFSPSVTETIAACGFETWAPQPGRHSFTNTLITVLEDWQYSSAFTAAMLHCEVLNRLRHEKPERYRDTKRFEYRKSPIHILSTSDPKARSVELCPRGAPKDVIRESKAERPEEPRGRGSMPSKMEASSDDSTTSLPSAFQKSTTQTGIINMDSLSRVLENGDMAVPHVLISLALEEEQLLDFEQCRRWLQDFPALAKYAKVQGVFRSNSTLLVISVPVIVWDWIPNDNACVFLGYVHSHNLMDSRNDIKQGRLGNNNATSQTKPWGLMHRALSFFPANKLDGDLDPPDIISLPENPVCSASGDQNRHEFSVNNSSVGCKITNRIPKPYRHLSLLLICGSPLVLLVLTIALRLRQGTDIQRIYSSDIFPDYAVARSDINQAPTMSGSQFHQQQQHWSQFRIHVGDFDFEEYSTFYSIGSDDKSDFRDEERDRIVSLWVNDDFYFTDDVVRSIGEIFPIDYGLETSGGLFQRTDGVPTSEENKGGNYQESPYGVPLSRGEVKMAAAMSKILPELWWFSPMSGVILNLVGPRQPSYPMSGQLSIDDVSTRPCFEYSMVYLLVLCMPSLHTILTFCCTYLWYLLARPFSHKDKNLHPNLPESPSTLRSATKQCTSYMKVLAKTGAALFSATFVAVIFSMSTSNIVAHTNSSAHKNELWVHWAVGASLTVTTLLILLIFVQRSLVHRAYLLRIITTINNHATRFIPYFYIRLSVPYIILMFRRRLLPPMQFPLLDGHSYISGIRLYKNPQLDLILWNYNVADILFLVAMFLMYFFQRPRRSLSQRSRLRRRRRNGLRVTKKLYETRPSVRVFTIPLLALLSVGYLEQSVVARDSFASNESPYLEGIILANAMLLISKTTDWTECGFVSFGPTILAALQRHFASYHAWAIARFFIQKISDYWKSLILRLDYPLHIMNRAWNSFWRLLWLSMKSIPRWSDMCSFGDTTVRGLWTLVPTKSDIISLAKFIFDLTVRGIWFVQDWLIYHGQDLALVVLVLEAIYLPLMLLRYYLMERFASLCADLLGFPVSNEMLETVTQIHDWVFHHFFGILLKMTFCYIIILVAMDFSRFIFSLDVQAVSKHESESDNIAVNDVLAEISQSELRKFLSLLPRTVRQEVLLTLRNAAISGVVTVGLEFLMSPPGFANGHRGLKFLTLYALALAVPFIFGTLVGILSARVPRSRVTGTLSAYMSRYPSDNSIATQLVKINYSEPYEMPILKIVKNSQILRRLIKLSVIVSAFVLSYVFKNETLFDLVAMASSLLPIATFMLFLGCMFICVGRFNRTFLFCIFAAYLSLLTTYLKHPGHTPISEEITSSSVLGRTNSFEWMKWFGLLVVFHFFIVSILGHFRHKELLEEFGRLNIRMKRSKRVSPRGSGPAVWGLLLEENNYPYMSPRLGTMRTNLQRRLKSAPRSSIDPVRLSPEP